MRLREYKSTFIDKGLNYFISVKLNTQNNCVAAPVIHCKIISILGENSRILAKNYIFVVNTQVA